MNEITTQVEYARTWSTRATFRVVAIINGQRTTICCGHSHSSIELAEKCQRKHFDAIAQHYATATFRDISHGCIEARWEDGEVDQFRFLPDRKVV